MGGKGMFIGGKSRIAATRWQETVVYIGGRRGLHRSVYKLAPLDFIHNHYGPAI